MEIKKQIKDNILYVSLTDNLDTLTSKTLLDDLDNDIKEVTQIIFDFTDLKYISSAGLRALLTFQKALGGKENIIVKNANGVIRNIFQATGFFNLINVELWKRDFLAQEPN